MKLEEVWARSLGTEVSFELGSGDFGTAYELENGKVIKITTSLNEACCSALALNEHTHTLVPVHAVKKFPGGQYGIYMDLVDQDVGFECTFNELDNLSSATGLCITELDPDFFCDYPELEDIQPSEDVLELIEALTMHIHECQKLGFNPEDIKFDNAGIDSKGNVRFFDHLERRLEFTEQFLLKTIAEKTGELEYEMALEP